MENLDSSVFDKLMNLLTTSLYIIPQILIIIGLIILYKRVKHFSVFLMILGTALTMIAIVIQHAYNYIISTFEQMSTFFTMMQILFTISGFLFAIGFLIFILRLINKKITLP